MPGMHTDRPRPLRAVVESHLMLSAPSATTRFENSCRGGGGGGGGRALPRREIVEAATEALISKMCHGWLGGRAGGRGSAAPHPLLHKVGLWWG